MDPLFGPKCNVIKHISQSTIASHRLDKMEIQIQTLSGNFNVSISHTDTILDLKKKIDEAEGMEPEEQTLSLKGYIINDDNVPVSELTQLGGGNIFSLALPAAGATRSIISDRQLHLITGSQQDFKTHLIPKNETKRYNLPSKKFGIVFNKEGSDVGTRVFHVEKFKVKEKGTIDIKTVERDGTLSFKVTLLDEENLDGPGQELMGVIDTYDERNIRHEDGLTTGVKVAKILGHLGSFIGGVGAIVF